MIPQACWLRLAHPDTLRMASGSRYFMPLHLANHCSLLKRVESVEADWAHRLSRKSELALLSAWSEPVLQVQDRPRLVVGNRTDVVVPCQWHIVRIFTYWPSAPC